MVDPSDAPEIVTPGIDVTDVVTELALAKAQDVALRHPHALIIGADTLVARGPRIFGKPRDAGEAREMLQGLSDRSHRAVTGLVVLDAAAGTHETRVVETEVTFRELGDLEIESYLRTGEPYDKAGAYGIQGLGAVFIERIVGDHSNVFGLPLPALNELLKEAGACLICRRIQALSAPTD